MKLTDKAIDDLIKDAEYQRFGTLTICVLTLTNGAQIVGQSNVLDPANFSAEIGMDIAFKEAREQIWQLEGYAMKTRGA